MPHSPQELRILNDQTKSLMNGDDCVVCECGKSVQVKYVWRCLYCNIIRCKECSEKHFGKTVAEWNREKSLRDCGHFCRLRRWFVSMFNPQ